MTHIYEALKTQQADEAKAELLARVAVKHEAAAVKLHELCEQLVLGHNVIIVRTEMMHTQVVGYVCGAVTFMGPATAVTAVTQSFSDPSFDEIADMAYTITLDAARDLGSASLVELLTL